MNDWSNGKHDDPLIADHRNFYKIEKMEQRQPARDCVAVRGQQLGQGQIVRVKEEPAISGALKLDLADATS